jgi:PAS domain S-box-containing protein
VSDDPELASIPAPLPDEPHAELARRLSEMNRRLARVYLWASAGAFAILGLALAWLTPSTAGLTPPAAAAACGAFAGLSALASAVLRRHAGAMMTTGSLLGLAGVAVVAAGTGSGVASSALGLVAFHASLAMALGRPRVGPAVTGAGIALVVALAFAQSRGWLVGVAAGAPLLLPVLGHGLLIVLAAVGGRLAARFAVRFMRDADERERRFQGLLQIAADAYWELDPRYAVQVLRSGRGAAGAPFDGSQIGRVPWEQPEFDCDPEALDQLQADLGARQPVRAVPVTWRRNGTVHHLLVSGEPRFSARGVFLGYWGVVRDVSHERRARTALQQTESRYQDLFTSLPTALVLHRSGRILDANPAAVSLFGFADEQSLVGSELLDLYDEGESRSRARDRIQRLQALPPGEALPVSEFQLVSRRGRRLSVRGTGVVVDTDQGRAVLSIYVDETERQAAEDAVRRSEALLSHLVASSPDVITLTEIASGRYAMVNRSFERLTGWRADEVVGRTSGEVGVWASPDDRARLVAQVREHGRVRDMPLTVRRRDGSTAPVLVSGARFAMDRRDYLVLNARDMTEIERNRLEREAILDNASVGIALTRERRFLMANPAFEAMLGWPDGSIVGQPGSVVWPSEADYAELGRRVAPALARGEQVELQATVRRRDGSTFLCRLLARAVDPSHPSGGSTIWVMEDVTERVRLNEALAKARDAAEAASRAKSAFLANTSHELRTPLNGLLGLAQLARAPGLDEMRRGRYLDQIVDSAQGLSMIVSDILDLAKIEAGRMAVERVAFDLHAMLQSLHRGHVALAAMRGLTIALDVGPGIAAVVGDALRVRQILTNYLSNAIKFTGSGGVRLVVRRGAAPTVRFEVHDSGPGIDEATQSRLFEPFTQADDSTTRRFGGTGLGLSICRQLAQIMGGRVGLHSVPGQGSCFFAELPLPAVDKARLPGVEPTDAAAELARLRDAHVLMVDDNEVNMMVAVAQLEHFGVRVGQAVDGREALDAVAAAEAAGDPYDLVMMDMQMPVLSGCEVTRELRRSHPPEALPIVAYTAAALVSEREAALRAGMNDFLPKPTDSEQLRAMLARWVRR